MTDDTIRLGLDERGVATLTINRPQVHNAFDDELIVRLLKTLEAVEADPRVRLLILCAEGKNFSAGADLSWMRRMADYSPEENLTDAEQLASLMARLNDLSKPTIARVQGLVFGGGVGLVACCDMAVVADNAGFALSETRLGLIPAVISPYVIAAVGERAARRYMLTAERFDAAEAHRIGLVHEVVPEDVLDQAVEKLVSSVLLCGPNALSAVKSLIFAVSRRPTTEAVRRDTAERITSVRASDEGREGVSAFLQKRPPAWIPEE